MKKVVLIWAGLCCIGFTNQSFAVRSVSAWTWTDNYHQIGGAGFSISGLLPYYEEKGEPWLVLGLYSYDDGTKALSAAIEYNTPEILSIAAGSFPGFANFWTNRLSSVGINSQVNGLRLDGRMRGYNYSIVKIERNQIEKLRTLTTNLDKFESMKFSDFYTMNIGPIGLVQSFVECVVAGGKKLFLREFINCFLADPGNKEHVTKNMFGTYVLPAAPQLTITTPSTTPSTSTSPQSVSVGAALQELSDRLNDLSAHI